MPDKAVSPGDKWEVPFEVKLPQVGTVKGKKIFWYQGEGKVGKQKTAQINVTSELAFDLKLEMGGAKITGSLSVTSSKGEVQFDVQHGRVVSLENELTLSGDLKVSVNGIDIPVATEQTQKYSMHLEKSASK